MTDFATEYVPGAPRIAYDRAGSGPLVVFLHGIGGNRTNWRGQLGPFAKAGCTAVSWDGRGYLGSDDYDGPLDFGDFAADLVRLLDHLGVKRAHLCGLSMGGRIAQDFYFKHSERVATMTLCDTHGGFSHLSPEQRADYVAARRDPLLDGKEPRDIAPGLVERLAGPNAPEAVRRELFESLAALRKHSYIKSLEATVNQDTIGDLSTIDVPTHFIVGEHDRLTTPEIVERMAKQVRGSRYTLIEDAGHLVNLEKPEAFNATALDFLTPYRERADAPA